MDAIFLSASVPVPGRGHYHETANPFLIQCAVRELVISVIRTSKRCITLLQDRMKECDEQIRAAKERINNR